MKDFEIGSDLEEMAELRMSGRIECTDGTSSKFWSWTYAGTHGEEDGTYFSYRWGSIGTKGQCSKSDLSAIQLVKRIRKKMSEGYHIIHSERPKSYAERIAEKPKQNDADDNFDFMEELEKL